MPDISTALWMQRTRDARRLDLLALALGLSVGSVATTGLML